MEEDRVLKHMCKFCSKSFPSGRSLGGHMRSHLINIDQTQNSDEKLIRKKKLPPLTNPKNMNADQSQIGYELRENPKKTNKFEEEDLFLDKICKECGKSFQSWKALFGHMKCHSVHGKNFSSVDEDSWNGSNDHFKAVWDSESDNEGANPCRRKRSDRLIKRYTSSSLSTIAAPANVSPCISEIDQQEQEEVAISLIMLSRDVSNWDVINSVVDQSSDNNSDFLESNKVTILNSKKSKSDEEKLGFKTPFFPRNDLKMSKSEISSYGFFEKKNLDNESEVNSPKKHIKKSGSDKFDIDSNKKNRRNKRQLSVPEDFQEKVAYLGASDSDFCKGFEKKSKFECTHCHKSFSSYQALGGHRASHKKFKGCCAPYSETGLGNDQISPNQNTNGKLMIDIFTMKSASEVGFKNIPKDHECPICFKVFSSGQALGGHKRSHIIREAKAEPSNVIEKQEPISSGIRDFLDLNLPAAAEEDDSRTEQLGLKPWWRGTSGLEHELVLGLI